MKIILAIDFSDASATAADEVAGRAWPAGTSIEVVHALDTAHVPDSALLEGWTRHAQQLVDRVAKRLDAKPVVVNGEPKAAIVDYARDSGADLVIVGPHQQSGLADFMLGSVAKAVIRYAPCSVEVVRGLVPKDSPRRILLATDGSEMSMAAARSIADRPWTAGTEVRILSAVELALTTFEAAFEPPLVNDRSMEIVREAGMGRAQEAVAGAEEIIARAGLKTSEAISVLVDSPKQIILDDAKQWGADLIAVGSHGRRGISRFMLGSVSEAVATHAACTVDVIRKRADRS